MMYHRGTLEQFNKWHTAAKTLLGIPLAPVTLACSEAIQNPNGTNDYVWNCEAIPDTKLPRITIDSLDEVTNVWFRE